jgi:DNA-binding MarR family transcriptional regulator
MPTTQDIADEFFDLLQGFIHLRPRMIIPEHAADFKKQMESLKNSGLVNIEDRPLLFRVLILLSRNKTSPTMGELSSELGIPLSTTTRIVDGLVHVNLLERTNDPLDRRVVRIQMSEYGKQFSQKAADHIKGRITGLLGNFTPSEQEQFLQLVSKLYKCMEAER